LRRWGKCRQHQQHRQRTTNEALSDLSAAENSSEAITNSALDDNANMMASEIGANASTGTTGATTNGSTTGNTLGEQPPTRCKRR
jgi:hypothetical protein